jgi:hypothetical protein
MLQHPVPPDVWLEPHLARARLAIMAAHAHSAHALVAALAGRVPPEDAVTIYCDRLELRPAEAEYTAMSVFADLDESAGGPVGRLRIGGGRSFADRLVHGIRRVRDAVLPLQDPGIRDMVEIEIARARKSLITVHVRHARRLVHVLPDDKSAPLIVAFYVNALDVPAELRAAVYSIALATLHGSRAALPHGREIRTAALQGAGA